MDLGVCIIQAVIWPLCPTCHNSRPQCYSVTLNIASTMYATYLASIAINHCKYTCIILLKCYSLWLMCQSSNILVQQEYIHGAILRAIAAHCCIWHTDVWMCTKGCLCVACVSLVGGSSIVGGEGESPAWNAVTGERIQASKSDSNGGA